MEKLVIPHGEVWPICPYFVLWPICPMQWWGPHHCISIIKEAGIGVNKI